MLPESLVVVLEGKPYLKFQASHATLVKMLLGQTGASFSQNAALESLKSQRDMLVLKAYKAKSQEAQLFEDEDSRTDAKSIEIEECFVTLDNGLQCGVQKKHKSTHDLLVLMETKHLDLFFSLILEEPGTVKLVV